MELSRGYELPAMPGGYQFGVDPGDGPFQVEARYKIFEPARVSDTTVTLAHTLNEALYADIRQGVLEHLAECVDVANGVEPATDACTRLDLKTPQEGEELRLVAVSPVSTERGYLGGIAVEAEVHAEHVTADGVPVPGTAQHVTWEGEIAPGPDGQLLVEHR